LEKLAKYAGLEFTENTLAFFDDLNLHYVPPRYEEEIDEIFSDMTFGKESLVDTNKKQNKIENYKTAAA
jgi:hypothetical protein